MRITIEEDQNIMKDSPADVRTVIIDCNTNGSLEEVLPLLEDALLALGYRFKGNLDFVDDFEQLD